MDEDQLCTLPFPCIGSTGLTVISDCLPQLQTSPFWFNFTYVSGPNILSTGETAYVFHFNLLPNSTGTRTGTVTFSTSELSRTVTIEQQSCLLPQYLAMDSCICSSNMGTITPANIPPPSCVAPNNMGTSCTMSLNERWFDVKVPSTGIVTIRVTATSWIDPVLSIYTGNLSNNTTLVEIACEDDNFNGLANPVITIDNQPVGTTLHIRVGTCASLGTGTFDICALDYASATKTLTSSPPSEIKFSPSPASDYLTVSYPDSESDASADLQILDITGRVLLRQTISPNTPNEINIAQLMPGIYIARIENSQGVVTTDKFVKQ